MKKVFYEDPELLLYVINENIMYSTDEPEDDENETPRLPIDPQ